MKFTLTLDIESKELIELAEYVEKKLADDTVAESLINLSQIIAEKVSETFGEKLQTYADTSDTSTSTTEEPY